MTTSASVEIRHSLRPGDLGNIVRMHGEVYATEYGLDHTFEAYVAEGIGRFASGLDAKRDRLWLADREGELVGSIAINGRVDGSAQLRWFLLHPLARRHGLGRRLLEEALSFSREREYRDVELWTIAELSTATRLYQEAGLRSPKNGLGCSGGSWLQSSGMYSEL